MVEISNSMACAFIRFLFDRWLNNARMHFDISVKVVCSEGLFAVRVHKVDITGYGTYDEVEYDFPVESLVTGSREWPHLRAVNKIMDNYLSLHPVNGV